MYFVPVCDVFAHSTHVFQAATCMQRKPGFANVDAFLSKYVLQKMAINRAFLQL